MASYDGISQVHGYGALNTRNKAVRKWTEEQTDLFAKVLSLKRFKDGIESTWSEELENLAVKKSSNEKLFKEIQTSLEIELLKVDQSVRDPGDEATFTIPQLRAKYKWLKREWKIIQHKIKHGLLREDIKSPPWYRRLHPIFCVYVESEREDRDLRPSMVSENGSIHNGQSNVDELSVSDSCSGTAERSWVVNIDTRPSPALDSIEILDVKTKDGEADDEMVEFENDDVRGQEVHFTPRPAEPERTAPKRTFTVSNSDRASPSGKIRKTQTYENPVTSRGMHGPQGFYPPNAHSCSCTSATNGDRYVEIIKYLLDAEERRERMFMDFQREQAESNRQHELKMAQIFVDLSSQQKILTAEISQIKEMVSVKRTIGDD